MWKEPRLLLDDLAVRQWELLRRNSFWTKPYPLVETSLLTKQAHELIRSACQEVSRIYQSSPKSLSMPNKFRREHNSFFTRQASKIEEKGDYFVILGLYLAATELVDLDQGYMAEGLLVQGTLKALVGSETQQLVGVRDGKPAWKRLRRRVGVNTNKLAHLMWYVPGIELRYVDQSDADLFPEIDEYLHPHGLKYDWPEASAEAIRVILEDAYYNQRYIVHPNGAYVKLRHFGPFQALTLKVKNPSTDDPNYHDFLVVAEVPSTYDTDFQVLGGTEVKKVPFVVNGGYALEGKSYSTFASPYLAWMTALIYHDLVTAKEVEGIRSVGRTLQLEVRDDEKPSWVYIPRQLRKQDQPTSPRLPTNPRSVTPHHVRGHLRKANLTKEHIKELSKFERETGLQVLHLLGMNPGHTFVRPYISPSMEDVMGLPKFIHARLQREINEMLQPKKGEYE